MEEMDSRVSPGSRRFLLKENTLWITKRVENDVKDVHGRSFYLEFLPDSRVA